MMYLKRHYGGKKAFIYHVLQKIRYLTLGYSYIDKIPHTISNDQRVVFVCKGNICRSALAHQYLISLGKTDTVSFGLDTHTGKPANERMLKASMKRNISLTSHKTTAIDGYNYRQGDILLCMEPYQCKEAKQFFPDATVSLLGLCLSSKRIYLHDPYAACQEYVETCTDIIILATQNLFNRFSLKDSNE